MSLMYVLCGEEGGFYGAYATEAQALERCRIQTWECGNGDPEAVWWTHRWRQGGNHLTVKAATGAFDSSGALANFEITRVEIPAAMHLHLPVENPVYCDTPLGTPLVEDPPEQ